MKIPQTGMTLDKLLQDIEVLLDAAPLSTSRQNIQAVQDEASVPIRYILIEVGSLRVALPMNGLVEVGPLPVITPLPHLPPWILGIVNVRSEIVSVVDLAGFLGLPKDSNQRDEQLVIIKHQDVRTGIPIERVYGTVNRSRSEQIIPLPAEIVGERKSFFAPKGFMVDDQMYSIFDIQQLFTSHRFLKYHQTM